MKKIILIKFCLSLCMFVGISYNATAQLRNEDCNEFPDLWDCDPNHSFDMEEAVITGNGGGGGGGWSGDPPPSFPPPPPIGGGGGGTGGSGGTGPVDHEGLDDDCAGVENGTAYTDDCGNCVGGNTDKEPCKKDCNNEWGGTAYTDDCGNCVGGTTKNTPCNDPCAAKNALAAKDELMDRIAWLKNMMSNYPPNTELGWVLRTNGTTGYYKGPDGAGNIYIPEDYYFYVMHTHPDDGGLTFSPSDISRLFDFFNGGYIGDGSDFFWGIVTSDGCSFLHITDPDAFQNFADRFKEYLADVMKGFVGYGLPTDVSTMSGFLRFLDYSNSGLTFIMGTATGNPANPMDWDVKEAGPNDTVTNKDCD